MYLLRHLLKAHMKVHADRDRHAKRRMPPLFLERLLYIRYELLVQCRRMQAFLRLSVQFQVELDTRRLTLAIGEQLRSRGIREFTSA
jgi:hypothetical protein